MKGLGLKHQDPKVGNQDVYLQVLWKAHAPAETGEEHSESCSRYMVLPVTFLPRTSIEDKTVSVSLFLRSACGEGRERGRAGDAGRRRAREEEEEGEEER